MAKKGKKKSIKQIKYQKKKSKPERAQRKAGPDIPGPEQDTREKILSFTGRTESLILGMGVMMALVIRMVFWHQMKPLAIGDMAYYIDNARALAAGDIWGAIHYHYPPFYSILIFILHGLGAGYETAARLISALSGSLLIVPIYLLAKYFFDTRAALFSLALWLFAWLDLSVVGYAESLFCLFVYMALYLALISDEKKKWPLFISALLLGLANMAKSEALLYSLLIAVIVFLRDLRPRFNMIPAIAGYALIFMIVILPYAWAYHHQTGKFTFNPKSSTLFLIYNTNYVKFLYQLQRDETGYFTYAERVYQEGDKNPINISPLELVRQNFSGWLKQYFRRIPKALSTIKSVLSKIFPGAIVLFILCFIRTRLYYSHLKKELPLYFILTAGLLSICLFDPWERFFSSLLPVLVIIVGKGADQSVSWLGYALGRFPSFSSEKIYRYSLAAAGILILALFIYGAVFLSRTEPVERIKEDFAAKKDMAEWLKPRISQDDNILASSVANRISFFLDISPRRQYLIPLASLPDTIAYARQNQVKYIIVTGTDLSRARQFIPIFKTNAQYPGINLEVFSQKPGQVPYAIYRVLAHSS